MIQEGLSEEVASERRLKVEEVQVSAMPGERAFQAGSTASAKDWREELAWVGGSKNSKEVGELKYREWWVERTDDGETEAEKGKDQPRGLRGISDRRGEGTLHSLHTYCAPGRLQILTQHQPSTITLPYVVSLGPLVPFQRWGD